MVSSVAYVNAWIRNSVNSITCTYCSSRIKIEPIQTRKKEVIKMDMNELCKGCVNSSHGIHCAWILTGKCKLSMYKKKEVEKNESN